MQESETDRTEAYADNAAADHAAEEVFGTSDNARETAALIGRFVDSWEKRQQGTSPERWLANEFRRFPAVWKNEEEIASAAREIVAAIEGANAEKASLNDHLEAGRSKESWLAGAIERGAAATGAKNVAEYAERIYDELGNANASMSGVFRTQSGNINRNPNLDGFVAEHHHADTFNLDAAAKGSPLRARVMDSHGRNSMDIGIYDKGNEGRLVRRYQVKYGRDADATGKLFRKGGNYPGQRKLGPAGQSAEGQTDVLEHDGVRSKPLSKEQAKALQERGQSGDVPKFDWNDVSRIQIARSIGRQALIGAAVASGLHGVRILARRVWRNLQGEKNPAPSKDLHEFFESSLASTAHIGAQAAVSGAVMIAAKSGWIKALQHTPPAKIAAIVHVGMENAKVLFKLTKGELNGVEALDAMGKTTCSAAAGLIGAAKGAIAGAALGPVGSFVGAIAGGIAGSTVGAAVYEGGKAIVQTAARTMETLVEDVAETARAIGRRFLNWVS